MDNQFDYQHISEAHGMAWNDRARNQPFPSVTSYLPSGWTTASPDALSHDEVSHRSLNPAAGHTYISMPRQHGTGVYNTAPINIHHPANVGFGLAQQLAAASRLAHPSWQYSYQSAHNQDYTLDTISDGSYDDCDLETHVPVSTAIYVPMLTPHPTLPMQFSAASDALPHYMPISGAGTISGHVAAPSFPAAPFEPSMTAYHGNMPGLVTAHVPTSPTSPTGGSPTSATSGSPTSSTLEVCSLANSDLGWTAVNLIGDIHDVVAPSRAVFNPGETLHIRSDSSSSAQSSEVLSTSYEDMPFPMHSPTPESTGRHDLGGTLSVSRVIVDFHNQEHEHAISTSPGLSSLAISPQSASPPSPSSHVSPRVRSRPVSGSSMSTSPSASTPSRRRRSPTEGKPLAKTTSPTIKKEFGTARKQIAVIEKQKNGGRKGPLSQKSREQASEIRRLRACLRCKFLKKTCDSGTTCNGCHARHARLWQVPCTRIDIKDVGNFIKDFDYDYKHHIRLNVTPTNVKGYAKEERVLYITHGFGHYLPVKTREAFVVDDSCIKVDWIETQNMLDFETKTGKLATGFDGISKDALAKYVDKHLDEDFDAFVDSYFQGTPFVSQILLVARRYYESKQTPVVRNALKLIVAYTLTVHVTLIDGMSEAESQLGRIDNQESRFLGKTVAPMLINLDIKVALGEMWRNLQREVLEELSGLYSSVYQGDKLKNWPTIFMVATILLAVWELMQFDCHFREPDEEKVKQFCNDMEQTPVGVIVGLFQAISQKLPSLSEWNTAEHGHTLNKDKAICDALTEVKENILQHQNYLIERTSETKFTRDDFDSLSNKFLSRMVIKTTS